MKLKIGIPVDHSGQNRAQELAKVPTSRSRSKTAVSFAAAENNEPAEAKNSKDTVMSRVDRRDVEGEREREKESRAPKGRRKDDGRMRRESGRKAQRGKTGPRVQREEQSTRCG